MNEECKDCGGKLGRLNPPVEDSLGYKFCINIFGWKLILLKDTVEIGCIECICNNEQGRERDNFNEAVNAIIAEHIKRGDLIEPR